MSANTCFRKLQRPENRLSVALTWAAVVFLNHSVAPAFNSDGKTDILWRNTTTDQNLIWWMQEPHWSRSSLSNIEVRVIAQKGSTCGPVCWRIAATADFNRDGYTDLLWRDQASGQNLIWLMQGQNKQSELALPTRDPADYVVGAGDFDGDGYPDIIWRSDAADRTSVSYLEEGRLRDSALLEPAAAGPGAWRAAGVGDFNNDGYPDLLWQSESLREVAYWYMTNRTLILGKSLRTDGAFLYPTEPGWKIAATGSFNQVGNTDIVWRRTDGQNVIWLMRDDILTRTLRLVPSMPYPDWQIGGTGGYITFYNDALSTHGRELAASTAGGRITLYWRLGDGQRPSIYRRVPGTADWGQPKVSAIVPSRWTDPAPAPPGTRVEYKLTSSSGPGEVIVASIADPPVHSRGTVILVVEQTVAQALANPLATLKEDLVGDGWKVRRVMPNVARHDDSNWAANKASIVAVRNAIQALYRDNPDAKAVLLIGHVPIPHSGANLNPDQHGSRSLPADIYYGDMDGLWTDSIVDQACLLRCDPPPGDCSCGYCAGPRHENHPGDGIWDQNAVPTNSVGVAAVELAVGRIDFANMAKSLQPVFPNQNYEVAALRRYFNKDDRYRRKLFRLRDRVVLGTYFHLGDQWQQQLKSGLRLGSRLFGFAPEAIINGDGFMPENGGTWVFHGGFGMPHHVEGEGNLFHATYPATPGDISFLAPNKEPQAGFFCLFGSCFEDIAYPDNVLRAVLAAGTDYNLGAMWFGQGMGLRFESLGLGETVGAGFVQTINDLQSTYLAWMGDPTLRVQIVAPPASARAARTGNQIVLTWTPSSEATDYFVYRSSDGLDGAWLRLTPTALAATRYEDTQAPRSPGTSYLYQVRAVKLTVTGSGSFHNLSQAAFSNSLN